MFVNKKIDVDSPTYMEAMALRKHICFMQREKSLIDLYFPDGL